jgi:hypothetical protein
MTPRTRSASSGITTRSSRSSKTPLGLSKSANVSASNSGVSKKRLSLAAESSATGKPKSTSGMSKTSRKKPVVQTQSSPLKKKEKSWAVATNLEAPRGSTSNAKDKENEFFNLVDYDALAVKEAYFYSSPGGMAGSSLNLTDTQEQAWSTPGKDLYKLGHSHKCKSTAWIKSDHVASEQDNGAESELETEKPQISVNHLTPAKQKQLKQAHSVHVSSPLNPNSKKSSRVPSPSHLSKRATRAATSLLKGSANQSPESSIGVQSLRRSSRLMEVDDEHENPDAESEVESEVIVQKRKALPKFTPQKTRTSTRATSNTSSKLATPSGSSKKKLTGSQPVTPATKLVQQEQDMNETRSAKKIRIQKERGKTPKVERYSKDRKAKRVLATVMDAEKCDSDSTEDSDEEDNRVIEYLSDSQEEYDKNDEGEELEHGAPTYSTFFEEAQGLKNVKTSNHTLSQLPVLESTEYLKVLKQLEQERLPIIQPRLDDLRKYFADWYFEMQYGFNLLFYGYGSKKKLLNEFASSYFKGKPLLTVNGFFPSVNLKSIMMPILELIGHRGPLGTLSDQIQLIARYFAQPSSQRRVPCLIMVVHNIDGQSLRNEKVQMVLSCLAEIPQIHLLASMDHINGAFLWDSTKTKRFNFIWHDLSTFAPWIEETTFENSILVKANSGVGGGRGVLYVLKSLNSNAQKVFVLCSDYRIY